MKKIICILSAAVLLLTVGTACGKKEQADNTAADNTTAENTWARFVTENGKKAMKIIINENEYEMNYLDESDNADKTEHYKNGKLTYYYVYADPDSYGNSEQLYYSADGKFFAKYSAEGFFDANGKEISEGEMQKLIDSHNK